MNIRPSVRSVRCVALLSATLSLLAAAPSDDAATVAGKGKLLFADDFNRAETAPAVDSLGNGWTTNSPWRADNRKQAFMADGIMWVRTAEGASHGAAVFHDFGGVFRDGAIQVRFRMTPGDGFAVEFNDPDCKEVHSGHIAIAVIDNKGITLKDLKAGNQSQAIAERIKREGMTPQLKAFLQTKNVTFPFKPEEGKWHQLTLVARGDLLRVSVDDRLIGELKSEGIAHATKRKLVLGATRSPKLDDFKIWSLDR